MKAMTKLVVQAVALALAAVAGAAPLDKVQFIKVSAQEGKAVIRNAEGKMIVVKPGDSLAENVTVKSIIPDRVILEEKTERGVETVVVRFANSGKVRFERLSKPLEKSLPPAAATNK